MLHQNGKFSASRTASAGLLPFTGLGPVPLFGSHYKWVTPKIARATPEAAQSLTLRATKVPTIAQIVVVARSLPEPVLNRPHPRNTIASAVPLAAR